MGILGALERFEVHLDRVAVLVDNHAVGKGQQGAVCLFFVTKREGGFVPSPPVVLQFAATPHLLELCLTGVLGGGVIEVPRVVGVHVETGRVIVVALESGALRVLLGEVFLTGGVLGLFFFLLLEFDDDLGDYFPLL